MSHTLSHEFVIIYIDYSVDYIYNSCDFAMYFDCLTNKEHNKENEKFMPREMMKSALLVSFSIENEDLLGAEEQYKFLIFVLSVFRK